MRVGVGKFGILLGNMGRNLPSPTRLPFYLFHAGYAGLAVGLQSLLVRLDPKPERRRALEFFRNGARLRAMKWEGAQEYPVYVINLDKDKKRMNSFTKGALKMCIRYERIPGLDSRAPEVNFGAYKSLLGDTFYGNNLFPMGSFASFLSHRKAWLRFLETSNLIAIICEDDALPIGQLPKQAKDFSIPSDADVVFVNSRMGAGFMKSKYFTNSNPNELNYYGIFDALMNICQEGIFLSGPGLDGYILTRQGAKKLLALYEELRYTMNNDWFVVFNSLSAEQRNQFRKAEGSGRLDKICLPEGPRLKSYVMIPSLVDLRNFASSIKMLDPTTLATRDQMLQGK